MVNNMKKKKGLSIFQDSLWWLSVKANHWTSFKLIITFYLLLI
ncbi:hypothetical protein SLEP1_g34649 [Rubroshorea leprosula]|uniref:Uncharacterized protein n=1 Tax=Rubroshorea leprosula TaxID=152421 RepID=A0AAV5KKQ2_9ROSI|nr:hypothetical protein SLEP1_g34649 [Rubroshorea leprosula]